MSVKKTKSKKGAPIRPDPNLRVLVGIVTKPGHHEEFRGACREAIKRAMQDVPAVYEIFETENPGTIWEGHNILIEKVLAEGWDYLFTVDADVIVNPDAFLKLFEDDVDGAFGTYDNEVYRKHRDEIEGSEVYNGLLIAGRFLENPVSPYQFESLYKRDIEGKVIADPRVFGGLGCSLFKRRLFEGGIRHREVPGGPGHDLVFQDEAWKKGFKLVLDGRVICEHLD